MIKVNIPVEVHITDRLKIRLKVPLKLGSHNLLKIFHFKTGMGRISIINATNRK